MRLALAEEDANDLKKDNATPLHDDISPSMLISAGLDLETQQCVLPLLIAILLCFAKLMVLLHRSRLKFDCKALDGSATTLQRTKVQERKNALQRKIKAWTTIQHLYMPEACLLRARSDRDASDKTSEAPVYDYQLHLPSSLPARSPCTLKLKLYEFKLREGQAYESLDDLRQNLRLRTHMYQYKDKNLVGQRANTRCQNLINRVQQKINASASKYNTARNALVQLSEAVGEVGWDVKLLPLAPEDIRALREPDEDPKKAKKAKKAQAGSGTKKVSEGHKTLSWIWKVIGVSGDTEDRGIQEGEHFVLTLIFQLLSIPVALRIEWCRARARAMRWSEEILLLREEMRRVLTFLSWHGDWWVTQAQRRGDIPDELSEGLAAYAKKQAHIRRTIRASFNETWKEATTIMAKGDGADNAVLDLGLAGGTDILEPPSLAGVE